MVQLNPIPAVKQRAEKFVSGGEPTCALCGFESTWNGLGTHVSRAHGKQYWNFYVQCQNCNILIERSVKEILNSDFLCCSDDCRHSYHSGERHTDWSEKVIISCNWCGDDFEAHPSQDRRFCSQSCADAWRGELLSEEPDEKLCEWCNEDFETSEDRRFCCPQCYHDWRGSDESNWNEGEKHYRWREDSPDYGDDWQEMRQKVLQRDECCQVCETSTGLLDVHHTTPRHEYNDVSNSNKMTNLIVLCRSCHMKVEQGSIECPEVNNGVSAQKSSGVRETEI